MAKIPTIERRSQQVNIEIDKGSTFRAYIIINDVDDQGVKTPKDLTGYTARMQIRSAIDSDTVLHTMTTENGGFSITALDGRIDFYISDTDSTAFDFEDAVYDFEAIDSGDTGDVVRYIYGDVKAFDEVTR